MGVKTKLQQSKNPAASNDGLFYSEEAPPPFPAAPLVSCFVELPLRTGARRLSFKGSTSSTLFDRQPPMANKDLKCGAGNQNDW